jgi:hypothetical protein
MSQITETSTGQRMRIAAIVAAGVAVVLFLQDLIGTLSWLIVGYEQAQYNPGMYLEQLWLSVAFGILTLLAFAVGAGLSLWLLAPLNRHQRPTSVVVRGLLAAAVGAVLVFALQLVLGMIAPMAGAGPLLGHAFPWPELGGTIQAASMALQSGIGTFVRQAPVVVLVVVLCWLWLQKPPSQPAVSADTAEV